MENKNHTEVDVRGITLKLMTYTRSLELCAKMNYETENLDFIDTIPPDEVLYDLGACEGRFSIYAALKGVRVVSFEPEGKNFSVFTENLKINGIGSEKLIPVNAGVGAKNEKGILNIGQPWEGGHQKVVEHGAVRNDLCFDFVEKQEVDIVSIDTFWEDGKYPAPNYLKIDVDGSEMPFLLGASNTLQSKGLKGIIFELNETDPNFGTIIKLLENYGFVESKRYPVPNEPTLFNILFNKRLPAA